MKKIMTKRFVALALVVMMLVTTCITYTASAASLTITSAAAATDGTSAHSSTVSNDAALADGVTDAAYNAGQSVNRIGSGKWTDYTMTFGETTTFDKIKVYGFISGTNWGLANDVASYTLTVNGASVAVANVEYDTANESKPVATVVLAEAVTTNAAVLSIKNNAYACAIFEIEVVEAAVEPESSEAAPAVPADAQFTLDIEAPAKAQAGETINVVITVKNIKQELDAVEFYLTFDATKVAGVITESGTKMDAFMTTTPQYTMQIGAIELLNTRYEQITRYDAAGVYECKFLDQLQYTQPKEGEEYKGLINDGDLVITIPFTVLDTVADGDELVFATADGSVKGTSRVGVESVKGVADSATTVIGKDEPSVEPESSEDSSVAEPESSEDSSVVEPESSEDSSVVEPESSEDSSVVEPESSEDSSVVEPESSEDSSVVEPESSEDSSVVEPESSEDSSVVEPESSEDSSVVEPESSEDSSVVEPESSEIPANVDFTLDIEAPATANKGETINVVITVKNIKQELDAVEFYLTFDPTKVAGVITESGTKMDAFMTTTPQYTMQIGAIELQNTRYEQITRYDAVAGVYECKFLDQLQYTQPKEGEEYKGLINDGDLVITIPFTVLDTVADGDALVFGTVDGTVKGTTRATVTSVEGFADTATTYIGFVPSEPESSDDTTSEPSTDDTTSEPSTDDTTSEPSTDDTTSEPSTDDTTSEPSTDDTTSEPSTDDTTSEPSTDDTTSEPSTDDTTSEPSTDDTTSEPSTDDTTSEPSTDDTTSEPSTDDTTSEPSTDDTTSEPSSEEPAVRENYALNQGYTIEGECKYLGGKEDNGVLLTDGLVHWEEGAGWMTSFAGSNKTNIVTINLGQIRKDINEIVVAGVRVAGNRQYASVVIEVSNNGVDFTPVTNYVVNEIALSDVVKTFSYALASDVAAQYVRISFTSFDYVLSISDLQVYGSGNVVDDEPSSDDSSADSSTDSSDDTTNPGDPGDAGIVVFVVLAVVALAALVVCKKARRA